MFQKDQIRRVFGLAEKDGFNCGSEGFRMISLENVSDHEFRKKLLIRKMMQVSDQILKCEKL